MQRDKVIGVLKHMAHVEERNAKFASPPRERLEAIERATALWSAVKDVEAASKRANAR